MRSVKAILISTAIVVGLAGAPQRAGAQIIVIPDPLLARSNVTPLATITGVVHAASTSGSFVFQTVRNFIDTELSYSFPNTSDTNFVFIEYKFQSPVSNRASFVMGVQATAIFAALFLEDVASNLYYFALGLPDASTHYFTVPMDTSKSYRALLAGFLGDAVVTNLNRTAHLYVRDIAYVQDLVFGTTNTTPARTVLTGYPHVRYRGPVLGITATVNTIAFNYLSSTGVIQVDVDNTYLEPARISDHSSGALTYTGEAANTYVAEFAMNLTGGFWTAFATNTVPAATQFSTISATNDALPEEARFSRVRTDSREAWDPADTNFVFIARTTSANSMVVTGLFFNAQGQSYPVRFTAVASDRHLAFNVSDDFKPYAFGSFQMFRFIPRRSTVNGLSIQIGPLNDDGAIP